MSPLITTGFSTISILPLEQRCSRDLSNITARSCVDLKNDRERVKVQYFEEEKKTPRYEQNRYHYGTVKCPILFWLFLVGGGALFFFSEMPYIITDYIRKEIDWRFFLLKMRIIFAFMYNSLLHFITEYRLTCTRDFIRNWLYNFFKHGLWIFPFFGGGGMGVLIYAWNNCYAQSD